MDISINDYYRKINPRYKAAFFSTIVFGILSQGMGLFNTYAWHDAVGIFGTGQTYEIGRWMLDIIAILEEKLYGDGHYALPVFTGFLGIFLIALSACYLVKILDINNSILCILIGGLLVTFPVITGIMGYLFTFHYYMLGLFLATLGIYFICKCNIKDLIIGILFLASSIGIYQAFIPYIISIFLVYYILHVYSESENSSFLKLLIEAITIVISFFFSMIIYFGMSKLYLALKHEQLSDYLGMNADVSISEYINRIKLSYTLFFRPSSYAPFYLYRGNIIYIYYLILIIILILAIIMLISVFKANKATAVLLAISLILFPLSSNFFLVMASPYLVHSSQVYGQVSVFILLAALLDKIILPISKYSVKKCFYLFSSAILLLLNVMYCRYDNRCYMKEGFSQAEAISYFDVLVSRIKSTPGYTDELPIVYVNPCRISDKSVTDYGQWRDITTIPYHQSTPDYINNYVWYHFMELWCGYYPETVIDDTNYKNLPEVQEMPAYPDDGCIKIIDNVLVVKLGENE